MEALDHFTAAYILIALGVSVLIGIVAVAYDESGLDALMPVGLLSLATFGVAYCVGWCFFEAWGHLKLWWAAL